MMRAHDFMAELYSSSRACAFTGGWRLNGQLGGCGANAFTKKYICTTKDDVVQLVKPYKPNMLCASRRWVAVAGTLGRCGAATERHCPRRRHAAGCGDHRYQLLE